MSGRSWAQGVATAVIAAAAVLLVVMAEAHADADDDYRIGLQAYRSGDVVGSMPVLRRAADAGHAAAQALFADILDASDFNEQAVEYYRKSAAQNHPNGQFGLGSMYAAGEGVKRDPDEARQWITRAAEQGHEQAINVIAHAYMSGALGVTEREQNTETALTWIKRAAANKYVPAIQFLASSYRSGRFGVVDVALAEQFEAQARTVRGIKDRPRGKKK